MATISFSNQKGGVAKSTTAYNVSYLLAEDGYNVLMIDYDPQASLTTITGKDGSFTNSMYEVSRGDVAATDAIIKIDKNLDLIPADIKLANLELEIVGERSRECFLKNALSSLEDKYDYIIIDCLPSLNLLLTNALVASDSVIIPCECDYLAYNGLDLLLSTIARVKTSLNSNINILGVVATFYDARTLHNRDVLDLLQELDLDIITTVSSSVKVKDATVAHMPLHLYDKKNKIVSQYMKIKEKIIDGK